MKVLVIGASRGIGFELVRQYRTEGDLVTATARTAAGLEKLQGLGAQVVPLDVADAASSSGLAWQIDGAGFDLVIYNAGVYGPRMAGLEPPSQTDFDLVMHTNVLGAMRVLPQVVDALAPSARVAVVSSRMGSLALRSDATGSLYRASKAALNSVLLDLAQQLKGRATCVAMHPGWVKTDMGGPGAELSVAQSVAGLRRTLGHLTPAQHGQFLNHDGSLLPW